jgi:hypothetical protein
VLSPRDEHPTAEASERTCVLRVDDAINKTTYKSSDRSGPNQRHYWDALHLSRAASLRARQVE